MSGIFRQGFRRNWIICYYGVNRWCIWKIQATALQSIRQKLIKAQAIVLKCMTMLMMKRTMIGKMRWMTNAVKTRYETQMRNQIDYSAITITT